MAFGKLRALGQWIMDLISIRVAGMWVHGVASSLPYINPNLNPVRMGNLYPGSAEKRPLLLKLIRVSLFWLIYLFTRSMLPFRRLRHSGENIVIRQRENGTYKCQGTLSFDRRLNVRQVLDCPIYAGMIEQLDQSIGIVLTKLDEHGLGDNTIICFTSDNGGVSSGDAYATSNLPLRGGKGGNGKGGFVSLFILKLRV